MPSPEDFIAVPPKEKTTEEIKHERKAEQIKLLNAFKENLPELKEMLLKWMEETAIPRDSEKNFEGWEYADVAIMHAVMRFRLGFLDKNEALDELELIGMGLVGAQDEQSKSVYEKLREVMADIEFDMFQFEIEE